MSKYQVKFSGLFFLIFAGIYFPIIGQNLVTNPGFETLSAAPTTYGQITNATGWAAAYGSPDLFHTSASPASVGIPANWFGTQAAHGGNAYGGIAWSSTNVYHEMIKVPLTSPLVIGNSYYAEAYVSAGEGSYRYGVNNFGFLLTTVAVAGTPGDPPIALTPQVNWVTPITDYTNWTLVSGTFTATTAAQYLTMGSFFSTAASTWVLLGTAGAINSQYWYIDDVVVQPNIILDDPDILLTLNVLEPGKVKVTWKNAAQNDAREYSVERSDDGGGLWKSVSVQAAGAQDEEHTAYDKPGIFGAHLLYRIRQVSGDGSISRSSVAKIALPVPLLKESLALGSNPLQQGSGLAIHFDLDHSSLIDLSVNDLNGKIIWHQNMMAEAGHNSISAPSANWQPGTYFLCVSSDTEKSIQKFVILPF